MMYPKLNIIPVLFAGVLAFASCGTTSNSAFGQAEDDVYFSKKESHKKAVYVPEVDVKEIIKDNPPQYGEPEPRRYNDNGSSNFNYDEYKARQEQNTQSSTQQYDYEPSQEQFLTTVPYAGQEEEAAEASRLRQQYYGNYNTYNTYNTYNSDPYYNGLGYNGYGYNNWGYPGTTVGLGWNSWGGWGIGVGVGMGWGWNSGWGYGWPHYNPYWGGAYGYNPWGWNSWYSPYYNNCGWGYGNCWYGNGYYGSNNWGYNGYAERVSPRASRPRQSAGSAQPRGSNNQPRANGVQTPVGGGEQQRAMPRSPNASQGQLINRDGKQIYVAPEQNRTVPRSYGTYDRSVNDAERQRQATPAPQPPQPRAVPRTREQVPAQYNGGNQPAPAQPQPRAVPRQNSPSAQPQPYTPSPQPRNYSPAPSSPRPSAPSAPSGGGGGSRGSSGGGGGSRGSMPRR